MHDAAISDQHGAMSQDLTVIEHQLARYFSYVGADVELATDFTPRTPSWSSRRPGERFEGRHAFTQWRAQTLATADDVRFQVRRTTVRSAFSVVELDGSYDRGASWKLGVQLADWDGDRIVRERIYVMDGFEAPEWPKIVARAPDRADPPANC